MAKMYTKQELVLRKTPSPSTKILDIIPMGESVSDIETLGTRSKVDYSDQEGWVPSSELTSSNTSKSVAKLETKDIENQTNEILEDVKDKYGIDVDIEVDNSNDTLETDKSEAIKSENAPISEVTIGESNEKKNRKK
mgnify:FL=1